MPVLKQEIFKEHIQKGKLHIHLHNNPTSHVSSSVHTHTHTHKSTVFITLLENSTITGMVNLSMRLKELLVSRAYVRQDGQRLGVLDSVSVTVKCLVSHIHGEVCRLGYQLTDHHAERSVMALFSRRCFYNFMSYIPAIEAF